MTTTDTQRHSTASACEALGVPETDWHVFTRWSAAPLTTATIDALYAYVDVMIAERCTRPTGDLVSRLVELDVDGEALTVDDIRAFVVALVTVAGTGPL